MEKPDCHIGILVRLNDVDYWVDVGNGYPYVEPYPLGSESVVSHPFFDYQVIEREGVWQVQHRFTDGLWRTNQTFENREVPYEFFDEMHEHHYKEIGWGPFLTGLRVNRWSAAGGFILRDEEATSLGQRTAIESAEDLGRWINQTFPEVLFGSQSTVEKAWNTFCHRKQELNA
jgi:arylamine N-acetyltransferase